jgi:Ca2+/Na+ antiporter
MLKAFAVVMGVFMIFTIVLFARTKRVGENNLFSSLMLTILVIAVTVFSYLHPTWWSMAVLSALAILLWGGKNSKQKEKISAHHVRKRTRHPLVINLGSAILGSIIVVLSIFILKDGWTWYRAVVWLSLDLIGLSAVLVVLHERLTNI